MRGSFHQPADSPPQLLAFHLSIPQLTSRSRLLRDPATSRFPVVQFRKVHDFDGGREVDDITIQHL